MAAGGCARLHRGGSRRIAGGLVVRRPRAQIHGGRKLRGRGSIGKVGGAAERELDAHGGRIEQAEGELYAPDSEEEEADMETKDGVAEGAAPVKVAAACSPSAALATDVGPAVVVAAHGAPAMEVSVYSDLGMELAPEVQARLKVVLAGKDPRYHEFFISLYKAAH
ncbi:unnamed protein product [Urochloa humidicola]